MSTMQYPAFFDQIPSIKLYDPLAHFLGASNDGLIEYNYIDIVRLAGHSCPTVASTYLMTRIALHHLYLNAIPKRGDILVEFPKHANDGNTGVRARVISMLTGAADGTGFKGINGKFDRRYLIFFNAHIDGDLRFTRIDTGDSVTTTSHCDKLFKKDEFNDKIGQHAMESFSSKTQKTFAKAFQERVRSILIDHRDDPSIITMKHVMNRA